jgi:nucleoside diphosphate kinase
MKLEKTLFIIKPDGMKKEDEILSELYMRYVVEDLRPITFDRKLLREFYPRDALNGYFEGIISYMQEAPCTMGTLKGPDAINDFYALCGKCSDPNECEPHTLRSRFGEGRCETTSGLYIVKNAIHRPRNIYQLEHDMAVLFGIRR